MTTLKDIAKAADCSTAVVSSVLNGASGNVRCSAKVAERVRKAARKLGYRQRQQSSTVLLRMDAEATAGCQMAFLRELTSQLERCRLRVELFHDSTASAESLLAKRIDDGEFCGVVLFVHRSEALVEAARRASAPVVVVNPMEPTDENCIVPDDAGGVAQMVRFLASCGVSKLAYIDVETPHFSSATRRESLRAGCAEHGMNLVRSLPSQGLTAAMIGQALGEGVDTFVTYYGYAALQVLLHVQGLGKRVSDDVNVVSLAGKNESDAICPLTHVEIPYGEMGRAAADALVDMLRTKNCSFITRTLSEQLVVGISCRAGG